MSSEKDSKSPATTSGAYDRMIGRWRLIETLLGGTDAMRQAGELYLPMHQEETALNYDQRLAGTVLLNRVEQTLDTLSGKPFSEPVKIGEDVPTEIREKVFTDIDMQGNNIDVFAREWFRQGMAKAFSHVLVDMPRPVEREDGTPRTLEDDRKEGLRPYWVAIKPECVLFARAEVVDGVEVLQHIRIFETYTEQDGFTEVEKTRIRILEPGLVELWVPNPSSKKEEWMLEDTWQTGIDYIPLVTFYANRESFMEGKPPLLDLAHLNITHWQSSSDQRHVLTIARFPILGCSGASAEDSDPIVVGPNKVLYNPDPKGQFYYIEHTGAAIEAGRKDLEDLDKQMADYGAEFLKIRPGNQTATARALDSAEASSDLAAMTVIFEDAVQQALNITSDWMNLGMGGGSVEIIKSFETNQLDQPAIEFLKYLREKNDISRTSLITAAKSRGILPEDFDIEKDWQQVVEEVSQRSELLGSAFADLDADQNDDDDDE